MKPRSDLDLLTIVSIVIRQKKGKVLHCNKPTSAMKEKINLKFFMNKGFYTDRFLRRMPYKAGRNTALNKFAG